MRNFGGEGDGACDGGCSCGFRGGEGGCSSCGFRGGEGGCSC